MKLGPSPKISRSSSKGEVWLTCPNSKCDKNSFLSKEEWRNAAFARFGNNPYEVLICCPGCKECYSARDWAQVLERREAESKGFIFEKPFHPIPISRESASAEPTPTTSRLL